MEEDSVPNRAVSIFKDVKSKEAAWLSGLGRWCCNSEVPGSRPPPCHQRDLFLGSPEFKSSVTLLNTGSQLVCLIPVGIFNYVTFI